MTNTYILSSDNNLKVAGGLCNIPLGTSAIQIGIAGCEWKDEITQSGWTNVYDRMPAHVLEVQVTGITGSERRIMEQIRGDIRATDLVPLQQEDDDAVIIRFEYGGTPQMKVTIEPENNSKDNCTRVDVSVGKDLSQTKSFHVVSSMSFYSVRVDLSMFIQEGKDSCYTVNDDAKIILKNEAGNDVFSGGPPFLEGISSTATRNALILCSPEKPGNGACTFNVTHALNANGEKIGSAGLDYTFLAGRPKEDKPHIRKLGIRAQVGLQEAKHEAELFVEGLLEKEKGESLKLPTHEPLMILRDPPGEFQNLLY